MKRQRWMVRRQPVGHPAAQLAVGQSLSATSAGHRRTHRQVYSAGRSVGRRGGEPSCK